MRCTCPICSWFVNPLTVKSSFVWILSLLLSAWVQKGWNSISKGMRCAMRYQKIFRRPKTNSMECWLMTCQTFARKLWPVKIKLFLGHFWHCTHGQIWNIWPSIVGTLPFFFKQKYASEASKLYSTFFRKNSSFPPFFSPFLPFKKLFRPLKLCSYSKSLYEITQLKRFTKFSKG